MFDGDATVQASGTRESADLDITLPMAYGAVKVGSPFGLYAAADVNWVGFGDNQMTDISASVGYDLPIPIVDAGLEVGYRRSEERRVGKECRSRWSWYDR